MPSLRMRTYSSTSTRPMAGAPIARGASLLSRKSSKSASAAKWSRNDVHSNAASSSTRCCSKSVR
eukprot:9414298-Lingulodinium_polyedra.AAC.1